MHNGQYNADLTPGDLVARRRQKPMPSEKEFKARHSFPGPDDNRHIDKFIKQIKH
ncbi:DUF2737 family protein [Enterobacteriaceae bacterium H11S18]|uniref:DUF2737 family protein n=1 Tax=Dryocola clanedunensis TaxID=2925396 RepID=UPI0022F0B147|nr:DUF2737 family protein [Dryocola clanedunensis]MCT4710308.1 DUF2737 family protein [Dryocola clanedunensis]